MGTIRPVNFVKVHVKRPYGWDVALWIYDVGTIRPVNFVKVHVKRPYGWDVEWCPVSTSLARKRPLLLIS